MTDNASFPVPLDHLITYVRALHGEGSALDHLTDAVVVGQQLDEQSDALIGHFVDQARRSGASWSQIGTSMGVSKQAAQKRFVPRWGGSEAIGEGQLFSRFTQRSRRALAAAGALAGGSLVTDAHLTAGLLAQPEGLAAKVLHDAGLDDERLCGALGVAVPEPELGADHADPAALRAIGFDASAEDVFRGTLAAVLRLGHNYVGTEHLLLGVLRTEGEAAAVLERLGVTTEQIEEAVAAAIARIQAERAGNA
ncbi:Clp protease N-terminal domain-containing protein [Luteimicrobium sp. DT211]|uniref:Clp protease N-terminal domain-containing protein n=1 Tax=Luteimicrobium sp. DT211 TaxID=3393412 RepID=UPI003CE9BE3F